MKPTKLVIGADLASSKIAFVARWQKEYSFSFYSSTKLRGSAERCKWASEATNEFLEQVQQLLSESGVRMTNLIKRAYVEMPVVATNKGSIKAVIPQAFTSGAVQAALSSNGYDVSIVPIQTWKKVAVDKGNASKEDVARVVRQRWPNLVRGHEKNQDILDACGLLIYGESLSRRP